MLFYYLLLGHLLGDFTFQTDKIAINKNKNWKWILLHSVIVTISMLLLAIPFGSLIVSFVVINGVLHFFIDQFKSKLKTKNQFLALMYFIFDQAAHILLIFFISLLPYRIPNYLPFEKKIIVFFITIVFILSFSAIFVQFILKVIFPTHNKGFFAKNERSIGNIIRSCFFIIFYLSYYFSTLYLFLIPAFIAIIVYFYFKKWSSWLKIDYFLTRVSLDLVMSMIGMSFLLFY